MNTQLQIDVKFFTIFILASITLLLFANANSIAFAESNHVEISSTIRIEFTTIPIYISEDNALPWGYVEGKIENAVTDYPVIIHISKSDKANAESDNTIIVKEHFAITEVNNDGTYHYKFRIINVDGNSVSKFQGDYTVEIIKAVYHYPNLISA